MLDKLTLGILVPESGLEQSAMRARQTDLGMLAWAFIWSRAVCNVR